MPQTLGDADARLRRVPHQAVLPAPCRSRARHRAFPHHDRGGAGADARAARPLFGPVPADLRARHSGRPRQVADRPELSARARGRPTLSRRGFQRRASTSIRRSDVPWTAYRRGRHPPARPRAASGGRTLPRDVPRRAHRSTAASASTAIYFLLARGERSHWHRVDAVEIWHYYAGAPLALEHRAVPTERR